MANRIIVKKTVQLGKIAYCGKRRVNAVDVEIELRECGGEPTFTMEKGERIYTGETTPTYIELSICGNIWNGQHTDIVCGGQCIDEIAKYINTPKMQAIQAMWKKWHLNGMNAGTPEQERYVQMYKAENGGRYDYTECCEYLRNHKMYVVNFTGKTVGRMYNNEPYLYGHGWVVNDLPEYVIEWAKRV